MIIIGKIKTIEHVTASTGRTYQKGTILTLDRKVVPFKDFEYNKQLQPDAIFEFEVTENEYRGKIDYVIKSITETTNENIESLNQKYSTSDVELSKNTKRLFFELIKRNTSEKAINLLVSFFEHNPDINKRFFIEQAAKGYHDARPVGLALHTYKMLKVLETSLSLQDNYNLNQTGLDLIYLGTALHDVGKVLEYKDGEMTNLAKVTHRGLGIEILVKNKDLITMFYDEDFYYELICIVNQHHGVFEERPHTVFSYLVHLIDMFDTHTTALNESMSTKSEKVSVIDRNIPVLTKELHYMKD